MVASISRAVRAFFGKGLDMRVRLFNLLAAAGFLVSAGLAVMCVVLETNIIQILTNVFIAGLSMGLLVYSYRTGNYQLCYTITVLAIFIALFTVLFFSSGGYKSGMPSFFIFAVMFTVFMLSGRRGLLLAGLEIVYYSVICVVAYLRPETVIMIDSEMDLFIDIWGCCMLISVILGVLMLLHFKAYNEQQELLEIAREEAVKLSEIKSTFLANMSHEIRTPINVILGMNEMVLRESDSDVITGYARNIESAGNTLLGLVNNVLDVSKIESGKTEVIEEEYLLADLVNELSLIGQERSVRRSLTFRLEVDETLPSRLKGDYMHIKQIAMNFLSNAAKYTEEGGVTLSFSSGGRTDKDIKLLIRVTDTGIGIKKENIKTLFDAFTRLDMPAHKDIQGSGLGLAIAKELADVLGGAIHVYSRWGEGSAFTLELAQRVVDESPVGDWRSAGGVRHEHDAEGFIAPAARVLAVDDNGANLQVLKALLARTMMHVDTALGGVECLRRVELEDYHVILMDYRMPDMDGMETFKRLRERPGFDIPVIAITANATAESEREFLEEGFAAYLTKPVMWDHLERALMEALPNELLVRGTTTRKQTDVDIAQRQSMAAELAAYDIEMEKGLRYLNGDIDQYKTMASIFIGDYPLSLNQVETLAQAGDWQRLSYPLHSLKSKARMAGATSLSNVSAAMERRCLGGDGTFIEKAMPLLLMEWGRAIEGLQGFIEAMDKLASPGDVATDQVFSAGILLEHVRSYRHKESEAMLRAAMRQADGRDAEILGAVLEAIDSLDFEKAEYILLTLMEHSGGN